MRDAPGAIDNHITSRLSHANCDFPLHHRHALRVLGKRFEPARNELGGESATECDGIARGFVRNGSHPNRREMTTQCASR